MNHESPPIDIQLYDLKQCFDAMWLEESMNDLCDTLPLNECDKKIALVYQNNCNNLVSVKTPFGLTERTDINKIVTQGGVWGPIQCSNQIDKLGKECLAENKHLFTYKGVVKVPPLAMIDDILAVALCGMKSVATNTFINTKIEIKKLLFSTPKCGHIHVGKCNPFCPDLEVHGETVSKSKEEKYLGDIVAETLANCNSKNTDTRKNKGIGIVAQIMYILDTVSLGSFVFEIALVLREGLLVNGILYNTEVWYGTNESQINELEDVDRLLLRRILKAPISTPQEALYLELGLLPIPYIIKGRRIMFLHYLMQLEEYEMLHQFFQAQWNQPSRNDWVLTVQENLQELDITLTLQQIKNSSHDTFKNMVLQSCRKLAFSRLLLIQGTHSKMSNIRYDKFQIQPYFLDGAIDARALFLFRTRMVRVGNNYRGTSDVVSCPLCKIEVDSQEHLLRCTKITNMSPNIQYLDIFGEDLTQMKNTLDVLKSALETRENFLKE